MADYWAERMVATRAGFVVGHSPTMVGGRALLLLFYCCPAAKASVTIVTLELLLETRIIHLLQLLLVQRMPLLL